MKLSVSRPNNLSWSCVTAVASTVLLLFLLNFNFCFVTFFVKGIKCLLIIHLFIDPFFSPGVIWQCCNGICLCRQPWWWSKRRTPWKLMLERLCPLESPQVSWNGYAQWSWTRSFIGNCWIESVKRLICFLWLVVCLRPVAYREKVCAEVWIKVWNEALVTHVAENVLGNVQFVFSNWCN